MARKRRLEFCNRPGSRSRCAILDQELCRARSFHPAPSNRADSHSKTIRNRSGCPVVGKHSRSPAAAACNTELWRARVRQARSPQRSQQPKVFSLFASYFLVPSHIVSQGQEPYRAGRDARVRRGLGKITLTPPNDWRRGLVCRVLNAEIAPPGTICQALLKSGVGAV
jgi:hypothetical protein